MNELNQKLVTDLKVLSDDVQQILQVTAGDARQELSGVRERLRRSAERVGTRLAQFEQQAGARAREVVSRGNEHVRDHPWQAVGIAGALGLLIGLALRRRD